MDLALNKPMRYSLTVVGVLSGEAIRVKRTWCKHLVSVYHLLMLFLPIISIVLYSTNWPLENKMQEIALASNSLWLFETIACNTILLIFCYWNSGFKKFYNVLDECICSMEKLSITVVTQSFRIKRTAIVLLCWIFGTLPLIVSAYENISTSLRNPLIADYYKQPAIICLVIVSNFSSYQWIFIAGYISYTTYTLWILVCRFNEKLEEDMEGSRQQVLNSLHAYRSLHLQLCGVIESANDHMRLLLGTLFVFSTIVVLLMIYSTTYLKLVKLSAMIWFLYLAFTLIRSGWLMLIIFLCDRLAASITQPGDSLLHLYEPGITVTTDQFYQMQLFLNQITKSEGFSAMGMMSVNKEFGLTLAGLIVTYYLVIDQMVNSATLVT